MSAPAVEALKLQRPLSDGAFRVVARGERQDGVAEIARRARFRLTDVASAMMRGRP